MSLIQNFSQFAAAALLLFAASLLGACVAPTGATGPGTSALDENRSATDARTATALAEAVATNVWQPAITPMRARPAKKPAFVANLDPNALIGLARADVAALLGPPKLLRRDPPAEMWQYRSDACVLHVFMYVSRGGHYLVRHVEVRDHRADIAAPHCYATLINAPATTQDSG